MTIPNTVSFLPLTSSFIRVIPSSSTRSVTFRSFASDSSEDPISIGQKVTAEEIMDVVKSLSAYAVEPGAPIDDSTDIAARLKDISYQIQEDPHVPFGRAIYFL